MTYTIPTILEKTPATMDGLIVQDSAGNEFFARIWSVTGLTAAAYTRILRVFPGSMLKAAWQYNRMGGCGSGVFVLQGGVADMDDAVKNEWEFEIVRGGGALSTSVWYKGRIVRYSIAIDSTGQRKTTIWTEGYVSKLREIIINSETIAAAQTVKQAVQTILDTYVTPVTRIRYHADDIVGAYALVGTLVLKNVDVLSTLHKLAMLQGSTEWGVTEGGTSTTTAPAFYFKAEATTTSETAVFMLENSLDMSTGGTFQGAYNTVYVLGGLVSNAAITGTANDATAVNTYGARSIRVLWAALQHATDANRLASNYVSFYKDGAGRYCACLENPTSRLEPDRTNNSYGTGSPVVPATPKAQWWGDSAKLTEHWQVIAYTYEPGCAIRFHACGCGGLPPDTVESLMVRTFDSVDALANMMQQIASSSLPQALDTTDSPTFVGETLTGGTPLALAPGNGASLRFVTVQESLTILAAPTTTAVMTLPPFAHVMGLSVRVTTTIPTAATFTVTDGLGANFVENSAALTTTAGSTDGGTRGCPYFVDNSAAQAVIITPNLQPAAATGVVRLTLTYYLNTPPTS